MERECLKNCIIKKFRCTPGTFYNWASGKCSPASRVDRETITRIIISKLNISVRPETLFPAR